MTAFGTFLKQMGTAIYNTRAFSVYGEGPTKMGGGEFTSPTALTTSDIRYTKSKDGDAVYAILGGWPGNGKVVNMTAVTTSAFAVGSGKVYLFAPVGGIAISLSFTQDTSGLHVTLPSAQPYTALAYAIKISKGGTVPTPTPTVNNGTTSAGGTGGTGGASTTGGAPPAGGAPATGGTSNAGGTRATGGSVAAGGNIATGGLAMAGGTRAAGGTSSISNTGSATTTAATGGSVSTGGTNAAGGAAAPTGGALNIAGGNATGGLLGLGGADATGGSLGAGGQVVTATTNPGMDVGVVNTGAASNTGGCSCRVASEGPNSKSFAILSVLGALIVRSLRTRSQIT
jgi:alpha-L-fucosidase